MKKFNFAAILVAVVTFFEASCFAAARPGTVDITDISADAEKNISWSFKGNGYIGANVYKLDDFSTSSFVTKTTGYTYKASQNGAYVVKGITQDGETHGRIVTVSDELPFSVTLNSYNLVSDSVSCDITAENMSSEYVSGVVAVRILNNEEKTVNYSCISVALAPGMTENIKTSAQLTDGLNVEIGVWDSKAFANSLSENITINLSEAYANKLADSLESRAEELSALIAKCEEKGISTDYETVNYRVIERFADYVREDISNGDYTKISYTKNATDELYKEAKADLLAYLNGVKEPLTVPKYVTSDMTIDGQSMIATVEDNGKLLQRPVFFVGYGHFETAKNDIPLFNDFGANTIQNEIGPMNVMKKVGWNKGVSGGASGTFAGDTEYCTDGDMSLKITYDMEYLGNRYITVWQNVAVEEGKTYVLSGKVKAENAKNVWISANDYSDRNQLGGTYDWKDFSVEYTAPADKNSTVIRILAEDVTEAIYFDELSFKEKGGTSELLGDNSFEKYNLGGEYIFDKNSVALQNVKDMLKSAEENNIAVSMLLSPHYFMSDVIENYGIEYTGGAFLKYNVNAPIAREIIENYLRGIIPEIKDYKSINNIVISNEPHFLTEYLPDFYTEIWQNWLRERYNGDIEALNELYNSDFADFNRIDLTISREVPAKYYDNKLFNDEVFGEWHRFMADIIEELAPDIPLNTKITGYTSSNYATTVLRDGTGYEEYYDYLKLNGCDFWNCIDDNREPLVKEMWYDYMLSFKNAPIVNSEDHVISDGSKVYTPEVADYVAQDIYQGAIHGRAMSDIWVWERTTNPESSLADSILNRPDAIAKVGKVSHDLNRLAYEITAIQNDPAEVGIIYSNANVMLHSTAMHAAYEAYEAVLFNGQKTKFVLDINPEAMFDYKLVIIPDVLYVPEKTLTTLKRYIENGGKVLVMNSSSLAYDEYGQVHDADIVSYIVDNSTVVEYEGTTKKMTNMTKPEFCAKVRNALIESDAYYVKVLDVNTNEPVHNIEYNLGVYDNKVIVNLSNFGEEKKVKIFIGDQEVLNGTELRKNEAVGNTITVGKYQTVTVKTDVENGFRPIE